MWYRAHLGIDPVPTGPDTPPWVADGGVTVFAPFAADTDYFPADRVFMLNFRVSDLDSMIAHLRGAGVPVEREETMDGIGRLRESTIPKAIRSNFGNRPDSPASRGGSPCP